LWEHGEPSHSVLCYDSTLREPFLVRPPGGAAPGTEQRRAEPVSVVDVFPTFATALGLAGAPPGDGHDLLAGPRPGGGVMFESWAGYLSYGWAPLVGWAAPDLKVLFACEAVEAYDTAADPDELVDLSTDPARADAIAAAREATRAVLERTPIAAEHGKVDEALLADIRGLGYAGGGEPLPELPPALEPCGLPNPSAHTEHIGQYERALELADRRRPDEAIALLQTLRAANAKDVLTRDALARLLFITERWEECAAVTEELLALHPGHVGLHRSAGACYEHLGRLDDAARHYRRAIEIEPDNERARGDLERVTR
jgi:tetratricopeptide (TPR) repeat protein